MHKINRSTFLKQSLKAGALVMINPLPEFFLATEKQPRNDLDEALMKKLTAANDEQVSTLLSSDLDSRAFGRRMGSDLALLTASYCATGSRYFGSTAIVQPIQKLAQRLLQAQAPDGTANFGNLESPPDTAFLLESVTAAAFLLEKEKSNILVNIKSNLREFCIKAGEALVTGGVHTPNHRWVVSAALARLNASYPNKKYVERIEDWLGEGVYINSDGNYPERSRIYSLVENNALLTIGRLLNKPALFEHVRKNLETTYYYSEPNGDLATNDSRRQDQWTFIHPDPNVSPSIVNYYLLYRYMAVHDNNKFFAAIANMIEGMKAFEGSVVSRALISFLEEPLLQKALSAPAALPVNYEKLFAKSHLLRIRRNDTTTTLFGGVDWPLTIASGRSSSPDFFSYRKGAAVLKYLRLSTNFFSTGYFYSEGLRKEGTRYILSKKLDVPYYQPLPQTLRKKDGDYALSESVDHRFWNKMDFEHRPVSNVKSLETTVSLVDTKEGAELTFDVKGQAGVNVTIELCFAQGGKLSGASAAEDGNYFLESGMGIYELGGNSIQFGPGAIKHKSISNLEGERYTTHFGSLRTDGVHVYLTGITPFTHKLRFE